MKSQRTQNESLFGANFGAEAFFENEQGEAVTVNGDRYRVMLNECLFTKIEEKDICNIWFQQDGSTCHTAECLAPFFFLENRIISRKTDIVWPPISCDLTPLDYYLWGAVKDFFEDRIISRRANIVWRFICGVPSKISVTPETIDALKDNIREAIGEIQLLTIDNVLKNWNDRLGHCMAS